VAADQRSGSCVTGTETAAGTRWAWWYLEGRGETWLERKREGQKEQGRVLVVCVWGGLTLAHADVDAVGTGCVCEGGQGAMPMHCPA
jgi:hypothetical protein